ELVRDVKPTYTPEALRARVQGLVTMRAIVMADGSIARASIMRSLDAGLDQEALRTVRLWRFRPGMRGGKPVPVMVEIEMMFTLRCCQIPTRSADRGPQTATPEPSDAGRRM